MVLLLMVGAFATVASLYLILHKLDRFIKQGGFVDGPIQSCIRVILVFESCQEKHHYLSFPEKVSMKCVYIKEPYIPENVVPAAVLALSDNDLNNLLICNEAAHFYPDVFRLAICNNRRYRPSPETLNKFLKSAFNRKYK